MTDPTCTGLRPITVPVTVVTSFNSLFHRLAEALVHADWDLHVVSYPGELSEQDLAESGWVHFVPIVASHTFLQVG